MKRNANHSPYTSLSFLVVFVCMVITTTASAQYAEQTFTLQPGWNAVFLEVEPQDRAPEVVFQKILKEVESVWMWNPRTSFVQDIQKLNELSPEAPEWLVWSPTESDTASLFAIFGERPYLIKLTGDDDVPWTIVGTPKLPCIQWQPNSLNLVGFHLEPENEPTFADFFSPSDAHGNATPKVYRLNNGTGKWEAVRLGVQMQHGEAYWVYCDGASDYTGPLSVKAVAGGLDFGKMGVELDLGLHNKSKEDRTISVTPPPDSSSDQQVPLSYFVHPTDPNQDPASVGWKSLTTRIDLKYAAGKASELRLAVRRRDLPDTGRHHSLLEVTDNAGMRILVPVSAEVSHASDRAGLWVGSAIINAVNEAADAEDPTTPKPTASEFTFRLIMHVDDSGQLSMLREVMQLWKPPVTDADGNETEAGRVGLFTNAEALATAMDSGGFSGVGLRDGRAVGRRISAAAFSFSEPLRLTGSVPPLSGPVDEPYRVSGAYTIGFDDPLNPFKHQYHPDHDNKNTYFQEGEEHRIPEAYEFERRIELTFNPQDLTNLDLAQAGWGDIAMGGNYREEISGVSGAPCFKLTDLSFQQLRKVDVDALQFSNYSTMVADLEGSSLKDQEYCLEGSQEFKDGEPIANSFLTAVEKVVGSNPVYPLYKGHILRYAYRPKLAVEGVFRLQKVSDVGVLNDGQ